MKKKEIIILIVACLAVLFMSFGVTYAFLTAKDEKINSLVVGENKIQVVENTAGTIGSPDELTPGMVITKEPHIVNTGNLPCFVRARIDFSDNKAENFCEELKIDEKWEYNSSDGYYYYKDVLQPNSSTNNLFDTVTIKTKKADGTEYTQADLAEFEILVYAESVHQGEKTADEYLTAWN